MQTARKSAQCGIAGASRAGFWISLPNACLNSTIAPAASEPFSSSSTCAAPCEQRRACSVPAISVSRAFALYGGRRLGRLLLANCASLASAAGRPCFRVRAACVRRPPAADRQPVSPCGSPAPAARQSAAAPRSAAASSTSAPQTVSHRLRPPLAGPIPDAGGPDVPPPVSHPSRAARVRRWRLSGSLVVRRAASW